MNEPSIKLKSLADAERASRTDFIKSVLSSANHMVAMGTFIFGHPNVVGWVPAGRRIYLTIGEADVDFAKSDAVTDSAKYAWKRNELSTKASGNCLLRVVPDHHLKYILVDAFSENPKGVLLTCNLTPSGIDVESLPDAKTSSHEMVVELDAQETRGLADLARFLIFGTRGVREFKRGGLQPAPTLGVAVPTGSPLHTNGFGSFGLTSAVLECVSRAKSSVRLCSHAFDTDSALFPSLVKLVDLGVEVQVVVNDSLSNRRYAKTLLGSGLKVTMIERMHAKAILVDDSRGFVCTSNFSQSGLGSGINIGVECSAGTPARLTMLRDFFAKRI